MSVTLVKTASYSSGISLTSDNLACYKTIAGWATGVSLSSKGRASGKVYYEIRATKILVELETIIGVCNSNVTVSSDGGVTNAVFVKPGVSLPDNTFGIAIDIPNKTLYIYIDGVLNSTLPYTFTGDVYAFSVLYRPTISDPGKLTYNFGRTTFKYPIPVG